MNVGLDGLRCETGPLVDRLSGWPGDTFERCSTHDCHCVIVSGDFGECVISVEYITCHVKFAVSFDPLGLVRINIRLHTIHKYMLDSKFGSRSGPSSENGRGTGITFLKA